MKNFDFITLYTFMYNYAIIVLFCVIMYIERIRDMKTLIKAILAGFAICVGGIVYLTLDNHMVGALLFSIGLFTIYTFELDLYTGKICFVPNKELSFLKTVGIVYVGNLIGTVFVGYIIRQTKLVKLVPYTENMVNAKLSDTLFSSFIMAIFCGALMSIAVIGFKIIKDGFGKYLALMLPVTVFILSGFEHSIADMFYISVADAWSSRAIIFIIVVSLGNLLGGTMLPYAAKVLDGKKLGCE